MKRRVLCGLFIALGTALLVQTGLVGRDYVRQWAARAWRNRNVDAMRRNATFLLGERASRYVDFLRETVPEDGTLVLPGDAGEFSEQSILQFFLMPRTIPGCNCGGQAAVPSQSCVLCLREPSRYVPAIGSFPPSGLLDGIKEFVPYPEDTGWFHGLWLGDPGRDSPEQLPAAPRPVFFVVVMDILAYVALAALGGLLLVSLAQGTRWPNVLASGLPLGAGLTTLTVFVAARAGVRVTTLLFVIAWVALMVVALVGRMMSIRKPSSAAVAVPVLDGNSGQVTGRRVSGSIWTYCAVLLVTAAVLSVARGYSIFDAIANWALKGYAIAYEGSVLAGAQWGGHALAYPQNLHLQIALFRLIDGDTLPGSKLLDPLFALALGVGLYEFWRWVGVGRPFASMGVPLLLSTPIIFQHVTFGYANFMYATYLMLGVTQFVRATDEANVRRAALAGLLLGLAAWTRPEGGLAGLGLLLVLTAHALVTRRKKTPLIAALLPFAGVWATWLTFGSKYQASDEVGTILVQLIAQLPSEPPKWEILRVFFDYVAGRLLEPTVWGIVLPLGGLLLLAALLLRAKAQLRLSTRQGNAIAVAAIATVLICLGIVGLGFYNLESTSMLADTFDRAFIPAAIACWTWAVAAIGGLNDPGATARA